MSNSGASCSRARTSRRRLQTSAGDRYAPFPRNDDDDNSVSRKKSETLPLWVLLLCFTFSFFRTETRRATRRHRPSTSPCFFLFYIQRAFFVILIVAFVRHRVTSECAYRRQRSRPDCAACVSSHLEVARPSPGGPKKVTRRDDFPSEPLRRKRSRAPFRASSTSVHSPHHADSHRPSQRSVCRAGVVRMRRMGVSLRAALCWLQCAARR